MRTRECRREGEGGSSSLRTCRTVRVRVREVIHDHDIEIPLYNPHGEKWERERKHKTRKKEPSLSEEGTKQMRAGVSHAGWKKQQY